MFQHMGETYYKFGFVNYRMSVIDLQRRDRGARQI